VLTVKVGTSEAGLGLEGGEGAREPDGIEEGGDGDHRGPRARGRGGGGAGPPARCCARAATARGRERAGRRQGRSAGATLCEGGGG